MTEPRYPTLHVAVPQRDLEEASAMLWSLGATGVEERDESTLDKPASGEATLVAHFDEEDRARIAASALRWPAELRHIVGDAWRDEWKKHFKPTRIGERLVIRPSWESVLAAPDDVLLTLDPGQAFGTGTHESTRLVLTEVEARVRGGETVLDVGCGSGILSIAALLLGAERAVCIDNDELAIAATEENAEMNGVTDRVAASTTPLARVNGRFDLVLANIESRVLLPMAPTLVTKVAPGGTLVLSGLLAPERDEILAAYRALEPTGDRQERDWIALTFRAPAAEKEPPARTRRSTAKKTAPPRSTARAKKSATAGKPTTAEGAAKKTSVAAPKERATTNEGATAKRSAASAKGAASPKSAASRSTGAEKSSTRRATSKGRAHARPTDKTRPRATRAARARR